MARFEHGDHPHRKFWEIMLKGSVVSTASGKVGMTTSRIDGKTTHRSGPSKVSDRDFRTVDAARRAYDRMIAEKQAAGYRCIDADTDPATTAPATTAVHRNAALEAAILEDAARHDPAPYLVYADWLQERGDPRGELIALHHAMQGQHDSARFLSLRQQDRALHHAHDRAWLGSQLVDAHYRIRLDWRLGFVDVARLDARTFTNETRLELLVAALHAAPVGCAVRRLILRTSAPSQTGPTRVSDAMLVEELAGALAVAGGPGVRAVDVHCHHLREPAAAICGIRELAGPAVHRLETAGIAVAFSAWTE